MDIRVLKYFLAVAREGNITKAADTVHVTQPTLSRQLMELEDELGTELLLRGKRQVTLTSSGILFQQRAQEIVALFEKTARDIAENNNVVEGVVSIGCVETAASLLLPDALETFISLYPKVQYQIYTGDGDYIREKIDGGFVDVGILVEPVEIAKYEFISLPFKDTWGVLMRKEDPLSKKDSLRISDIIGLPFFLSHRRIVTDEIEGWFGKMANKLNILGYHNLLTNTTLLIERGLCYSITVQGAYSIRPNVNLRFVPLSPEHKAGHVMAWKKNRIFGQATSLFLEYVKKHLRPLV
jgi:DNA-binding transcriptional LysR family regulator